MYNIAVGNIYIYIYSVRVYNMILVSGHNYYVAVCMHCYYGSYVFSCASIVCAHVCVYVIVCVHVCVYVIVCVHVCATLDTH